MKTPYFAFYAKDWRSDPKVQQLTLEEKGAYIHLLACMWDFQDESCSLPYDDTFICRLLNIRPAKWKKIKSVLIDGAAPVLTVENGRIFSKRLRQEFQISTQKCLKNFTSAKKRWDKKGRDNSSNSLKNKESDDANALPTECERNANGDKIKDTDTDTDTDTDKEKEEICANAQNDFEIFWQAYPRRKDKSRTFKLFNKINPDAELLQQMLDAIENQNTEKIYQQRHTGWAADWKHPATWLNGKNWNDEVNLDENYWRNKTNKRDGKKSIESLVEKSRRERAERRGEITPSRFASGFTIEHDALTDERD